MGAATWGGPGWVSNGNPLHDGAAQTIAHTRYRGQLSPASLGYTLGMDLILKLVAGLMAGLRAYFLLAAAAVAIPCLVLLVGFLVGLFRPSRARLADPPRPGNQ